MRTRMLVAILLTFLLSNSLAAAGRPVRVVSLCFRPTGIEAVAAVVDAEGAKGADLICLPETWPGSTDWKNCGHTKREAGTRSTKCGRTLDPGGRSAYIEIAILLYDYSVMKTKTVRISGEHAEQAAEVLKALGHPIRLRILSVLSAGPTHVTGLAEDLDVPPAIISQQLRILRSCRLVAATTENGHAVYRITERHLFRMLACVERCVTERAQRGQL